MAISIQRYVNITSGVGAGNVVPTRNLMGRFFTTNPLVPTHSFVEFDTLAEVGAYFTTSSVEYLRAQFYFTFINKVIKSPRKISFARWVDAATAPLIYGAVGPQSVASYTSISAGSFTITIGGVEETITGLDFSGAASLAAVAAIIQTAVRAANVATQWTAATVSYDPVRGSFNLVGGATGAADISVVAGAGGSDVAGQLGWLSATTIFSEGSAIQSITDCLTESAGSSNNFGSFTFIPTLTQDQIVEAAEWNEAQNNLFMYSVRCTSSNASALSAALIDIGGCTLTLSPLTDEYPEQCPMMILAATDYTARSAVQNYMFFEFDLTPSVTTDTDYSTYNALKVNFYGQTQTAGVFRQFYQRGTMLGQSVDPSDQNVYANEIWFKDAATAEIMTVLLTLNQIPANDAGRGILLNVLQNVINAALFNGTFSVGKELTNTQKLYITQVTGDDLAWRQVQNDGYWVDAAIIPETVDDVIEYKAVYTLIYSKNDVIRTVEGSNILI